MKNNSLKTVVQWRDAVRYDSFSIIPQTLPIITTTGTLLKKTRTYVLLENTRSTQNFKRNKLPKDSARYFFIPNHMIISISE